MRRKSELEDYSREVLSIRVAHAHTDLDSGKV